MPFRHLTATAALLLAGAALPAAAQDNAAVPDPAADTITIGAGAAYLPSYEGSDDYVVIPAVQARGRVGGFGFFTRGTSLYVDALPDRPSGGWDFSVGPLVTARLDRTSIKRIKDVQVRRLGKLDMAWELGGWAGIAKTGLITSDYDTLSFRLAYSRDVSSAHGSWMLTPTVEYGTPLSRYNYVGVSLSADVVGKGYGRYYYDISPAGSVASGLPAYSGAGAKSGLKSWGAGVVAVQSITGDLTKGLSVVVAGRYSRLERRYAASPIVGIAGDRDQWMGGAGLAWTF